MDIDLELDGDETLQADFEDLEVRGTTDAVYSVGTNVEYGKFLERGTRYMPPYPWFAPAIREFQANSENFVESNTEYTDIEDVPTATALVQAVAASLARQMERNVSAGSATDRSPGTHPDHPKEDTGNLKADIGFERVR